MLFTECYLFHFVTITESDFVEQKKGVLKMVCCDVKCVRHSPGGISYSFCDGLGRCSACDLRKAWPIPIPGARTLRFPRTMVVLCFWPLPTHLSFVFPLVAEYSAGFQIPLLGAMAAVLVVICTAVIVVATLARKVMSLAAPLSPGHPIPTTHPIPSLVLSCPLAV